MIEDEVYQEYEDYLEDASIIHIKDLATGEIKRRLAPKRGNLAYARKYKEKSNEIDDLMKGLNFDYPVLNSKTHRYCHLLLITNTYDHEKSIEGSWGRVSGDIAKMKISLKRRLEEYVNGMTKREYGRKKRRGEYLQKWQQISIRSLVVKEGQKNGYPAPHMILILDRPILCTRYKSKKDGEKWIIQSSRLWEAMKNSWPFGFTDIRGIVKNKVGKRSVIGYAMKYLIKSVKSGKRDLGFKTMAWQKHFNLRPMQISGQFREMLNPIRARDWGIRLDRILNESQQVSGHMWVFDCVEYIRLSDFDQAMLRKVENNVKHYNL